MKKKEEWPDLIRWQKDARLEQRGPSPGLFCFLLRLIWVHLTRPARGLWGYLGYLNCLAFSVMQTANCSLYSVMQTAVLRLSHANYVVRAGCGASALDT